MFLDDTILGFRQGSPYARRIARTRAAVSVLALLLSVATTASASERAHAVDTDRLYAVQSRLSTPGFQLFLNLNAAGTVADSGPLFGPAGGIYGSDFLDDTFYGAELENGGSNYFLATIPHEGALVGQGSRVSGNPIGFENVEGIAIVEGVLYATSIDFEGHRTQLLTVDPTTGLGTLVGEGSRNVLLVGLAWDARAGLLYGAAIPFGGAEPSSVDVPTLYLVDPSDGSTTPIGPFGADVQSLTWDADLGLLGAFEKLYSIETATGTATPLGETDFTDGKPGTFNGIYALSAFVGPEDLLCGDATGDREIRSGDALAVLKAAVGAAPCAKSVCDVNSSGGITAADAQAVLRNAVGQDVELTC